METNNKQLTDTSKAILWWQNIMWDEKIRLCNRYLGMHPNEIYSPEIKIIYKSETSLIQSNIPLSENPTQEIKEDTATVEGDLWKLEFDNDTGASDESYWEFYNLINPDGEKVATIPDQRDANKIAAVLNNHDALVHVLKNLIQWGQQDNINHYAAWKEAKELLNNITQTK